MSKNKNGITIQDKNQGWLTIKEAIFSVKKTSGIELTEADIYRFALSKRIRLSIYFQSLVILREAKKTEQKLKLKPICTSLIKKICMLESDSFLSDNYLTISTKGKYFIPSQRVIDTELSGYEYVLLQRLLALSLNIPLPITGASNDNYGITVAFEGETFQIFEKTSWMRRIQYQLSRLPESVSLNVTDKITADENQLSNAPGYFPLHSLPADACFVIRHSELEKLIEIYSGRKVKPLTPPRISTPLSRLFWLACKHNETISPLIRRPYKLLTIFEKWASDDGITDRLSGDTLKNALERGSPSSTYLSN